MNIEQVKKSTSRAGKGELIKHMEDKKITRQQAIKAKCYDCNGLGELNSCDIVSCPLLPYSPYKIIPTNASSVSTGRKKRILRGI